MKRLGMVLAGLLFAAAQTSADVAARVAVCAGCHGAEGISAVGTFPNLAGQNAKYLLKQLQDIRSGARSVPTMAGLLDQMSDADLADIAAHYAAKGPALGVADEALVALGETVYRAGVRDKGVAACAACHAPDGTGNSPAGFPRLAGQHAEYTAATLKAFRNDERTNDGDTRIMRDVASRLSDKEIAAVSSYIAGLR